MILGGFFSNHFPFDNCMHLQIIQDEPHEVRYDARMTTRRVACCQHLH